MRVGGRLGQVFFNGWLQANFTTPYQGIQFCELTTTAGFI